MAIFHNIGLKSLLQFDIIYIYQNQYKWGASVTKYTKRRMRTNNYKTITKTYLYNFDPLNSHFYIIKLGFIGVYIIFLISAQKHRLRVLVRTASARRF